MLKEKLEQEFVLPEIQDDIKKLKKENKESIEMKISEEPKEIKISEESTEESTEESIEIKSLKENENTTDMFDKNKFKKILAIVNSNKFNHKNKIGNLKYNDIIKLINNINNNTISETLAKENLNALNEIKKAEIRKKRLISGQKELLDFFNSLLDKNKNKNDNDNESGNEDDVIKNNNDNDNDSNNDNDRKIRQINNCFKMIDETKSFKDQIKLFKKKTDDLSDYWYTTYYDDDKEINLKIFKLKFAHVLNDVDENLFEEVFGHTFVTLANKLINTTSKEENQIIINDLKKNRDKLHERNNCNNFVIQIGSKGVDLIDAVEVVLEFNKTIQSDLT